MTSVRIHLCKSDNIGDTVAGRAVGTVLRRTTTPTRGGKELGWKNTKALSLFGVSDD